MKDFREIFKLLIKEIGLIVFVWIISIVFSQYSCEVVRTAQMEPRLKIDTIRIIKKIKSIQNVNYGEIVAYNRKDTDIDEKLFWGRVIAKENDRLSIKNNKIYLNGSQIAESYLSEESTKLPDIPELFIPANCIFVLNDTRNDPYYKDSRDFGPIYFFQIIGKLSK